MTTGPEPIEYIEGEGWYFWDFFTGGHRTGPFETEQVAREALHRYIAGLSADIPSPRGPSKQ